MGSLDLNGARRDAVHADPVRAELNRRGGRKSLDSALRGAIVDEIRERKQDIIG